MTARHVSRRVALRGGVAAVALAGTAGVAVAASAAEQPDDAAATKQLTALAQELRDAPDRITVGTFVALQVAADLIDTISGVKTMRAPDAKGGFFKVSIHPEGWPHWTDGKLLAELRERALLRIGGAS